MNRALLAILAMFAAVSPALADCDHFKWSVARELGWFKSAAPIAAEGGTATSGTGYAVTLVKDVKLPFPSERTPGKETYGAVIALPKLEPGKYHITLSEEAWIDVAENGALVKSSDFSGQRDCPGVRKSVLFDLAAGPATVEISNAAKPTIDMAIAPAP